MSWIRTIDANGARGALADLYDRVSDPETGRLDHIMRVHGLHPAGLAAHFELYRAVMAGTKTLRLADREMIALVVSKQNSCHY